MSLMFMDEDEARKAGLPLGLTPHAFPQSSQYFSSLMHYRKYT